MPIAGSYEDGEADIYMASLGSQASQYGFGTPMAKTRRGRFQSSYDPAIRMMAGPNFKGRVCPAGHMCKLRTYRKSNRTCDMCNQEIEAGLSGERCFLCEYDLCPGCSSNTVQTAEVSAMTPDSVTVVVSTDASAASGSIESSSVPVGGHLSPPSLPPIKLFSIFEPKARFSTIASENQDTGIQTYANPGKKLTEMTGTTPIVAVNLLSHPAHVHKLDPVRPRNRMKLKVQSSAKLSVVNIPSTVTSAALPPGAAATAESVSTAAAAEEAIGGGVTEVNSDIVSSRMLADTSAAVCTAATGAAGLPPRPPKPSTATLSPTGTSQSLPAALAAVPDAASAALPPASPSSAEIIQLPDDSPVSSLEAFRAMCRLHPDRKYGVSIGIQCSSPDPLFVDLRVPKTSLNPQLQLAPYGQRDEPTFEDFQKVHVGRGMNPPPRLRTLEIFVQDAQVVRMPRDGSCLYHALTHHTNQACGANFSILQLRKRLVGFMRQHSDLVVAGKTLQTWIQWECQCR